MSTLDALALILAAYRVATDLAWEDGPFEVFSILRGAAYSRFGADHWIANGLACPICLSFWFAWGALALWYFGLMLPVYGLAIAGGAALLARRGTA